MEVTAFFTKKPGFCPVCNLFIFYVNYDKKVGIFKSDLFNNNYILLSNSKKHDPDFFPKEFFESRGVETGP